jgi:hypothetical protein
MNGYENEHWRGKETKDEQKRDRYNWKWLRALIIKLLHNFYFILLVYENGLEYLRTIVIGENYFVGKKGNKGIDL